MCWSMCKILKSNKSKFHQNVPKSTVDRLNPRVHSSQERRSVDQKSQRAGIPRGDLGAWSHLENCTESPQLQNGGSQE